MRNLADPVAHLGGLPFIDDDFAWRRLLAAVVAVRHARALQLGIDGSDPVSAWLEPARAIRLHPDARPLPATPLPEDNQARVREALQVVANLIPPWAALLELPTQFLLLRLDNGAISASTRVWPQHVLVAAEAFEDTTGLTEHVLHELCHQWLYVVQEVWPLERSHARVVTLPSGTPDRSPDEVLGALHVSIALTRLYRAVPDPPAPRLSRLNVYASGCVQLLNNLSDDLTTAGRHIARRLEEAI